MNPLHTPLLLSLLTVPMAPPGSVIDSKTGMVFDFLLAINFQQHQKKSLLSEIFDFD